MKNKYDKETKEHFIKCQPEYFQAQLDGVKNFEIRKDDRHYKVGDKVILMEYDAKKTLYTGRRVIVQVTYITEYMQKTGYIVMGTKFIEEDQK